MIDDVKGAAFPFRIDPATGGVAWAFGADKIRQNVRLILGTRVGERPMLREFGSRLHGLVHEPNDSAIIDLLRNQAQQALLQWEPRILAIQTQVEQSEGEVHMRILYTHTNEAAGGELTIPVL
ncbi:GPW/gp25 family protein [Sorangium sp. So ce1000]|uniref:GPW/gp25 family protein n=1 Tax=Sorangium sp. So ce1000 TaxID=3133325 RepID=UPI003F627410